MGCAHRGLVVFQKPGRRRGVTHVEFTIDWLEVLKAIGYILLGVIIVLIIVYQLFKNFRVW